MESTTIYEKSFDTFPKLLNEQCKRSGANKLALRHKDRGIWKRFTWGQYYDYVKYFSLGMISLGLKRGDKVSILGENEPEWYWADLGIQAAGGIVVGIFTDCMPKEVQYYAAHSDSRFILAHDQEQVDKVIEIKDQLPLIEKVIYWDPKGLWSYTQPYLLNFYKVIELGKEYEKQHPGIFEENVSAGNGDDIALILYTSGTTGLPKGAMVSFNNILIVGRIINKIDPSFSTDNYVSAISPAWITEHNSIATHLMVGHPVSFPEDPETVQQDIRDIGPQIIFFAARQLEAMARIIQAKIVDAGFLKRFAYNLFLPVAYKKADTEIAGNKLNIFWKILYWLGDTIVFRNLRDKFGVLYARKAASGGAALSPDIIRFFRGVGINIRVGYGSSEGGVTSCGQLEGEIKLETAGRPYGLVEMRISEQGELLIRSPGVFKGYYKDEEATKKVVINGWYHTGDFCFIDGDGHVTIMGRMADVRKLSNNKTFSPDYAEIRLRFSPYLKDALVFGRETENYVTAIVNIDKETVGRWAEQKHIPYTTFTDLSQKPEVIKLVADELKKVNKALPEHARIKKFVSLNKEFDPDEAELTRTRKLRRSFVEQRFKEIIDAMYGDKTEIAVHSEITYRDGRKGIIETVMKINSIL
jgi:long-chain acyl-CoA synthetase